MKWWMWLLSPTASLEEYFERKRREEERSAWHSAKLPDDVTQVQIMGDKYVAFTKSGEMIKGRMPLDGQLRVGDGVINYHGISTHSGRGIFGYVSMQSSQVSVTGKGASVVSTGDGTVITFGKGLESFVEKAYGSVRRVTLEAAVGNVNLELSGDEKVYFSGQAFSEPKLESGHLIVDGGGDVNIKLPKSNAGLELYVNSTVGDISGDIAHKGRISTIAGDISLKLFAPLRVDASSVAGSPSIVGMLAQGRGSYTPPSGNAIGTLELKTVAGDICVEYLPGRGSA